MKSLFLRVALLGLFPFFLWGQVDTSSIQLFETLDEVSIERDPGVSISSKSILSQELISEVELRKAACCDLSESFETNAFYLCIIYRCSYGYASNQTIRTRRPLRALYSGKSSDDGWTFLRFRIGTHSWCLDPSIQLTKGPVVWLMVREQ